MRRDKHGFPCYPIACAQRKIHFRHWVVEVRKANYSAFNGGRRTPSAYSQLRCTRCGAVWRTKAAYVDQVPDANQEKNVSPYGLDTLRMTLD